MRHVSTTAVPAVLLLALASTACEKRDVAREETQAAAATTPPLVQPESVAVPSAAALEVYVELDQAHEGFVRRDFDRSAEALRSAGSKVRNAAERAPADARAALQTAADDLEKTAADVKAGTISSINLLDRKLAAVNASLARVHHTLAVEAWAAKDSSRAGRELRLAADQLSHGLRRFGRNVKKSTAASVTDAQRLGEQLAQRVGTAGADVEQTMQGLGREIERLAGDVVTTPR
jgi:hypothetical protein